MAAIRQHYTRMSMLALAIAVVGVSSQGTNGKAGCTFYDDNHVYNIELSKGNHDAPCPSPDQLNDQFKQTSDQLTETTHNVMQLQGQMLRLLEANHNLSKIVEQTSRELAATRAALTLKQEVATDCPLGYTIKSEEYKSCYMFVGRDLSWYNAQTFCMSTGGNLVAFETHEEMEFIVDQIRTSSIIPGNHLWTGGNDIVEENQWIWAGINKPINYTQWLLYPHEEHGPIQMPDNHLEQEHCLHLFHLHNYDWNDIYCGYLYFSICEHKLL